MRAFQLTLLAECLDPSDPEGKLVQLQNSLTVQGAQTWSDEQWSSWIESWNRLETWKTILDLRDNIFKEPFSIIPSAMLTGRHDGIIMASCTENMRLLLFLESMRQQLDNLKSLRTLTCPFRGRRRSCCGFGHFFRNIWGAIPNEEQRKLRPPSRVCLNYASIGSV